MEVAPSFSKKGAVEGIQDLGLRMKMDPSKCSFDQWLDLIFDCPDRWQGDYYWDQFRLDYGKRLLEHSIKLFHDPTIVLNRYSPDQIEQGFQVLSLIELEKWIWEKRLEVSLRRDCVESMVRLFESFFAKGHCGDACYMWWDHLRSSGPDPDLAIKEAVIEALSKILEIDSADCQTSALHGLGHLRHPSKRTVIDTFLKLHPDLDGKTKSYAHAAMEDDRVL